MPGASLETLLERNRSHVESLDPDHFEQVIEGQHPEAVSICCSDSRVSQEGMWAVTEPGWLFTPSTIGNQVWDDVEGELVVDGSVLYPIAVTETRTTVIVGHTGCGAVTAAYRAVQEGEFVGATGIRKLVELLVPVVRDAMEAGLIDPESTNEDAVINRLVEYNVDRQVEFLLEAEEVPDDERIYGFVYDFHGAYGDAPGTAYLVNANGETDLEALEGMVPDGYESAVERLIG